MGKSILLVEDDTIQAANLGAYLIRHGWDVQSCGSAEEALIACETMRPDAVVTDKVLPRLSGVEMIERLRRIHPSTKCVVMTGDSRARAAVEAMKAGACDYVVKPVVMSDLHRLLEQVIGASRAEPAATLRQQLEVRNAGMQALIGDSPAMRELKATIRQVLDAEQRVADGNLPAVLIFGETGTGKELVARALHFDGWRRAGPFVEINCASIPSSLLESELFGHEKGAFTDAKERRIGLVEAADTGTLFLDEIGEIDVRLQAKLLKLLEERTVRPVGSTRERRMDLRIVSATNRDLESMVRRGTFRGDLYFRLRIMSIRVPALRSRGNDILLLARHFLELHGRRYGRPGLCFSKAAEGALLHYVWPGNVRELRNMLEQAVLLARDDVITPAQLALSADLVPGSAGEFQFSDCAEGPPLRKSNHPPHELERDALVEALERTGWNVTQSAKVLGVTRDVIRYRIDKLGLSRPQELSS